MPSMSTRQSLLDQLRTRTEGTPYVVKETADGFDMEIDIVDAQWFNLMRLNGLQRVFTYEVALDEEQQKYSITDVAHSVSWDAGAEHGGPPTLHREQSTERGRVYSKSFHIETGVDTRTGEVGTPVNYRFDSSEGRDLIRGVLKENGWSEQMGTEQKIGLVVAGVTVAALVIIGIVALVMALLG
jgi:hypothetical protein